MRNLAPDIVRQRLVIEGLSSRPITSEDIVTYLSQLSTELDMVELMKPVTHRSEEFGWAGWIHWATSGAHFYAWNDTNFFSVDIYTCKAFSPAAAIAFTRSFFDVSDLESREF